MTITLDKILFRTSLTEFCRLEGKPLSEYEVKGLHFSTRFNEGYEENSLEDECLRRFVKTVPDGTYRVVNYDYQLIPYTAYNGNLHFLYTAAALAVKPKPVEAPVSKQMLKPTPISIPQSARTGLLTRAKESVPPFCRTEVPVEADSAD